MNILKVGDYYLLKSIGKGSFGEVFLGKKEGSDEQYAIKRIAINQNIERYLNGELSILMEINHINTLSFIDYRRTNRNLYIITKYYNGGTLSNCLQKYKERNGNGFPEGTVQYLMRQIVEGIKYLHGKNIVHRDIKLDNILVDFESQIDKENLNMVKAIIKIADFGISTHLDPSEPMHSIKGTPSNMDPIILKSFYNIKYFNHWTPISYNEKVDIFSLGIICFEMLTGHNPFNNENSPKELVKKVEEGNYHVPLFLSKESVSFLNGMLQYDFNKRLNAEELSSHPFLTKSEKEFKPINLTMLAHKVDAQGLKINIRLNQTITAVFQEDGQKALINVTSNYFVEKPLPEEEFNNNIEKNDIINKINILNNNINNAANNFINNIVPNYNINNKVSKNYNEYNYNNNNQYGNKGINSNPNNYFINMAKPHYYPENLNYNKNIYNNINPKIINQPAIPGKIPIINNNMISPVQDNKLLYQQNQTKNQALLNMNYQQYQPIKQIKPFKKIIFIPKNAKNTQNKIISNNNQFLPPKINYGDNKAGKIFAAPISNKQNFNPMFKKNEPKIEIPQKFQNRIAHFDRSESKQKIRYYSNPSSYSKFSKAKIKNNNEYILNTERNQQKEKINEPIQVQNDIQEYKVENNVIYGQKNNYINDNRQNYHKENLPHDRYNEKRIYQRKIYPLGKNQNNSCHNIFLGFNREKANIKNNNILNKITKEDIPSNEKILKQKDEEEDEKQYNYNIYDNCNFDLNLYEEVTKCVN